MLKTQKMLALNALNRDKKAFKANALICRYSFLVCFSVYLIIKTSIIPPQT